MTFEEYWREWWGDSWKEGAPVSEWSSGSIEQSRIACEEAWEAGIQEGIDRMYKLYDICPECRCTEGQHKMDCGRGR
jgi:hypothetical protein